MGDNPTTSFRKISRSVEFRLCVLLVAALIFFAAMWIYGATGDCGPQEIDGQCGISTFVGKLYGFIGGCVIVVVGSMGVGVGYWRRTHKVGPSESEL